MSYAARQTLELFVVTSISVSLSGCIDSKLVWENIPEDEDALNAVIETEVSASSEAEDSSVIGTPILPPVGSSDVYQADEGVTLTVLTASSVLRNDTDPQGFALSAVLDQAPAGGSVFLQSDGSFTYTPSFGFSGTDQFTYFAYNGSENSAPIAVQINVIPSLRFSFTSKHIGPSSPHFTRSFELTPSGGAGGYSVSLSAGYLGTISSSHYIVSQTTESLSATVTDSESRSTTAPIYVIAPQKIARDVGTLGRATLQEFGKSIAISNQTAVIGAPGVDSDEQGFGVIIDAGVAFVFTLQSGEWQFTQKLVASGSNSRVIGDRFGTSVGISGDHIVIGAPQQAFDEAGLNSLPTAGAAYFFTREGNGTWRQEQKIVAPSRFTDDRFASVVAIDGNLALIGAKNYDYNASGSEPKIDAGAAFIFTRGASQWTFEQTLTGTGNTTNRITSDNFGAAIGLSGSSAVIGAPGQDYAVAEGDAISSGAGAAYVFTRSTSGIWDLQQKLVASGTNGRMASDNFGISVDIDGDSAVIGANLQDYNSSGSAIVSNTGAAFVFTRSGGAWGQQVKLVGTETNSRIFNDQFGSFVTLMGNQILVGATNQAYAADGTHSITYAGAAYLFTNSAGAWTLRSKFTGTGVNGRHSSASFGVVAAIDGNNILVGSPSHLYDSTGNHSLPSAGAVFAFNNNSGTWTPQPERLTTPGENDAMDSDSFGTSVVIDGSTAVVGAPYHQFRADDKIQSYYMGAAYVYTRLGDGQPWTFYQKITPQELSNITTYSQFGSALDLEEDSLIVGAPGHSYDSMNVAMPNYAGAAYLFTRIGGSWQQQQKLVATLGRSANDRFGGSVSIDGDRVLIGAPGSTTDESGISRVANAGAAYVFTQSAGTWAFEQKLVAQGAQSKAAATYFGTSVSLAGETLLIGAPYDSFDRFDSDSISLAGSAYLFTRGMNALDPWQLQEKLTTSASPNRYGGAQFGKSVALNSERAVIGAPNQYHPGTFAASSGASWIFTRQGSTWVVEQVLYDLHPESGASFGQSVALSAARIVIGAPHSTKDEAGVSAGGTAYRGSATIFTRANGTWTISHRQVGPITATDWNTRDTYGGAVAIDGDTITIGAPYHDYDSTGTVSRSNTGAIWFSY